MHQCTKKHKKYNSHEDTNLSADRQGHEEIQKYNSHEGTKLFADRQGYGDVQSTKIQNAKLK